METRSTKTPKPLSEDEIRMLEQQLASKQQRLGEHEKIVQDRERDAEDRYRQLQKREEDLIDRERQQAERLATAQILSEQSQPPNLEEAAYCNPSSSNISITDTLRIIMQEISGFKDELAELRDMRRQQTGSSPPHRPPRASVTVDSVAPRLNYKEALDSVPTFDGSSTPVLKFTRACNRLREMFPPECEPTLTQLLRNKLKGRAYTAVEDDVFATIESFVEQLKTIFGASKSVNQYRGELGNIAKSQTEHVIDYISRVKDLHCAILEGETKNLGPLTRDRKQYFENETLLCFLAGLPPEFRLRLRLEGYNDLSSAYATAIRVEKEIDRDKVHFVEKSEIRVASTPAQVTLATDKPHCTHCSKPGHSLEKCWLKYPEQRPKRDNKPKREATPGATCEYCAKPGHTREQCYKRRNDENNSGNGESRPSTSGASRSEKTAEHPVRMAQVQTLETLPNSSESSDTQTSA